MGFRTAADEHLEEAASRVREAVKELSHIVIDQCIGHDNYNQQRRNDIKQSLDELITIRDRLE